MNDFVSPVDPTRALQNADTTWLPPAQRRRDMAAASADIYLNVLKKIGVAPGDAVGVEDSGNGIRSLRAAGMGVIAAPGPEFPLAADVLALADVRITEMTEFDLALVERAGAAQRSRRRP